mgnify:CR=1 FL=1
MILSDQDILQAIEDDEISIEPFDEEEQLQPSSLDLKTGYSFASIKSTTRPYRFDEEPEYHRITANEFTLNPREFVLATTTETIKLSSGISAFVEGRSSVGRLGLFTENAGWIDPGFEGQITLELFNASNRPIVIPAGHRVCQVVFARNISPSTNPYNGKYKHQKGATPSKIREDVI